MRKQELVDAMVGLLQEVLDDQGGEHAQQASPEMPLVGEGAAITSLALVALITEIEMTIDERYGWELTLVSEEALSRSKSPFRCVDALADYVLELLQTDEAAVQAL